MANPALPDRTNEPGWFCCQLGAREHYAIPRALNLAGVLREFITDFWNAEPNGSGLASERLRERFHSDLTNVSVRSANRSLLLFELSARARKLQGWQLIRRRNEWFQDHALTELARHTKRQNGQRTLFAYSYAAVRPMQFAREHSWDTVLGQIDPGPAEEEIVARLYDEAGQTRMWEPAPPQYWDQWHLECELANKIIVNSQWARTALISKGISAGKIKVIPLAFEPSSEALTFERKYPSAFTVERPLQVLFLGQINLRKGVGSLFEAIELLEGHPIEFWFVGPIQVPVPKAIQENARVKWIGAVTRAETDEYYRRADLFMFPTFSDGFGLTQLEAQSWKLPIITTSFCGEVVHDGLNGVVLSQVRGETIAEVLLDLLHRPEVLQTMSEHCRQTEEYSLRSLASSLVAA